MIIIIPEQQKSHEHKIYTRRDLATSILKPQTSVIPPAASFFFSSSWETCGKFEPVNQLLRTAVFIVISMICAFAANILFWE